MTYLERNRNSQTKKVVGLVGLFILAIAVLIQLFIPHIFASFFTSIVAPFWRTEFAVSSGSLLSPSDLLRDNQLLKREIDADSDKMKMVEYVDFENSELRAMLGKASSTPKILAAVLARPPVAQYDALIIDVGQDDNVSSTSIVYAGGDIPIGKVAEIFDSTSRAILFSSPGNKQDVLIGQAHIPAVSVGRGGGQYEVELPVGSKVSVGDFVLSASLDARPIGSVVSIENNTADPFEKILFAPSVNIYQLRWVLVDNGSHNARKSKALK